MLPKGPFEIWELPKPRTVYKTYQCTEIFSSLGFWQKWIFQGGKVGFRGGDVFLGSIVGFFIFFLFFAWCGVVWRG